MKKTTGERLLGFGTALFGIVAAVFGAIQLMHYWPWAFLVYLPAGAAALALQGIANREKKGLAKFLFCAAGLALLCALIMLVTLYLNPGAQ